MASYAKILPRRGTARQWSLMNPILLEGELVLECPDTGIGTGKSKLKIGDGNTPYNELLYAFDGVINTARVDGGDAETESGMVIIRNDTTANFNNASTLEEAISIFAKGELICIMDGENIDFKVGDGVHKFNELPLYSTMVANKAIDLMSFNDLLQKDQSGNVVAMDFGID